MELNTNPNWHPSHIILKVAIELTSAERVHIAINANRESIGKGALDIATVRRYSTGYDRPIPNCDVAAAYALIGAVIFS